MNMADHRAHRATAAEYVPHAGGRSHLAERDGKRHGAADGKGRANLDIPAGETRGKKQEGRRGGGRRGRRKKWERRAGRKRKGGREGGREGERERGREGGSTSSVSITMGADRRRSDKPKRDENRAHKPTGKISFCGSVLVERVPGVEDPLWLMLE